MKNATSYGQFCPLAMSSEFLCKRWMMLIILQLLRGSSSFNNISRGVPRMSRTLLSERLKELEQRGLVKKKTKLRQQETNYTLTESGEALRKVVFTMGEWGQEWLHLEPSLDNIDPDHLLWSIRVYAKPHKDLPDPFIVHIFLSDQPKSHCNGWLIFEDNEVEICVLDQDFEVDVQLVTTAKDLTMVLMGWTDFTEAIKQQLLIFKGPTKYTDIAQQWMGQSRLANIKKQPYKLRVS